MRAVAFFVIYIHCASSFVSTPAWRRSAGREVFLSSSTISIDDTEAAEAEPTAVATSSLTVQAPGEREDELFDCDESVSQWKSFPSADFEGSYDEKALEYLRENINKNDLSRAYWGSHVLRSGYFGVNSALVDVLYGLYERFVLSLPPKDEENVFSRISPTNANIASLVLMQTVKTYAQDLKWIDKGLVKYPWDALAVYEGGNVKLQFDHRQNNPLFALQDATRSVRELVSIFSRQAKGSNRDGSWVNQKVGNYFYPEYYLNHFHYQTDGWMSTHSADSYEAVTETIFLGMQDAMQRATLLPLLKVETKPETILEVGCGTGRFGTFLRDNFPRANVTLSDLSPFYLEKARKNDAYWRQRRANKDTPPATFVQANAEQLPFEDNSFDAVYCIYLFHEMPENARRRAAAEMVRVVKPGGIVVLSDSIQNGDRPGMEGIDNFSNFNEPHYENYIETFLPDLFEGCEYGEKYVSLHTKTLSFVKKA